MNNSCNGGELVAISSSIACLMAKDASVDELTLLSSVFELISNALSIIANSKSILEQCEEPKSIETDNNSDDNKG